MMGLGNCLSCTWRKESFETESVISPAISEPMLKVPCRNKKLEWPTWILYLFCFVIFTGCARPPTKGLLFHPRSFRKLFSIHKELVQSVQSFQIRREMEGVIENFFWQVRLTLIRDRRSIRKKSSHVLADFSTPVVKHSLNPVFHSVFNTEISLSEFKLIRLRYVSCLPLFHDTFKTNEYLQIELTSNKFETNLWLTGAVSHVALRFRPVWIVYVWMLKTLKTGQNSLISMLSEDKIRNKVVINFVALEKSVTLQELGEIKHTWTPEELMWWTRIATPRQLRSDRPPSLWKMSEGSGRQRQVKT